MIKANELRVGNRIIVRAAEYVGGRPTGAFNKKEIEVFAIIKHPISAPDKRPVIMFKDDDRMNEHFLNENVMPIPITTEWLERFGFVKLNAGWINGSGSLTFYDKSQDANGYYKMAYGTRNYNARFLFVHQLQNLYFALTGEELTIKQ